MFGHWVTKIIFDPNGHYGFIYTITCLPTGKAYIGKKNFRTKYGKYNKWREYTSSSKDLCKDIAILGKECFIFEIIEIFNSPADLSAAEVKYQLDNNVLREQLPSGDRKYYNRNIYGISFDTSGLSFEFSSAHKEKLSFAQTGKNNSFYGKHHTETHKIEKSRQMSQSQMGNDNRMFGKEQSVAANDIRRQKLIGKPPANKGKVSPKSGSSSPAKGVPKGKPVSCNGVIFGTVVQAAKEVGLSVNSVRHRLKVPQFPEWFYI